MLIRFIAIFSLFFVSSSYASSEVAFSCGDEQKTIFSYINGINTQLPSARENQRNLERLLKEHEADGKYKVEKVNLYYQNQP